MKLSRKERELQFRMSLVLDAAEEVFAESSYADASVEDIAKRAEISVGTLYNLFPSKEEVYRNVVSRGQRLFYENIAQRLAEARGPQEKIRAVVRYFFEHFTRYQRQFRFYNEATNGFQWALKGELLAEAEEGQAIFVQHLQDVCQQGLDQGIFKSGVSADILSMLIMGVPHTFLHYWLQRDDITLMDLVDPATRVVDRLLGATDE